MSMSRKTIVRSLIAVLVGSGTCLLSTAYAGGRQAPGVQQQQTQCVQQQTPTQTLFVPAQLPTVPRQILVPVQQRPVKFRPVQRQQPTQQFQRPSQVPGWTSSVIQQQGAPTF